MGLSYRIAKHVMLIGVSNWPRYTSGSMINVSQKRASIRKGPAVFLSQDAPDATAMEEEAPVDPADSKVCSCCISVSMGDTAVEVFLRKKRTQVIYYRVLWAIACNCFAS